MATHSSAQYGRGPSQRRGESRRRGQWKLAYADFLTALMAFFLLLWLTTGSSASERVAIAAYFTGKEIGVASEAPNENASTVRPTEELLALKQALHDLGSVSPDYSFLQANLRDDAVYIELTDHTDRPLFATGDASLNAFGENALLEIAELLVHRPFLMEIEGHTDAFPTPDRGNWRLSTARAYAAWDVLVQSGLDPQSITAIAGRADTSPLLPTQPHAPANRRITLIVRPAPSNRLN